MKMHSFLANLRTAHYLRFSLRWEDILDPFIGKQNSVWLDSEKFVSKMHEREDSLSSCNQKADCLRSHLSSMLVPTDR